MMAEISIALQFVHLLILLGIFLAVARPQRRRPDQPTRETKPRTEDQHADLVRTCVHAAVAERLDHEREHPGRYPKDHRVQSILQRTRRRLHFQKASCPDDQVLLPLIADELRRQA